MYVYIANNYEKNARQNIVRKQIVEESLTSIPCVKTKMLSPNERE